MNRLAMPLRPVLAHILALSIAVATAVTAFAQNSTWNWPNYNSATSWNAMGSWIGGIPTASNTAIFSNFGDQIVTVATGQLTGGITFSSPGAFTNDYYFTAGTLLPSNNAIIQTDSTYRGIANFNTAPTLQGNLTLSSNGQATSGLFFGGAVGTAASLGSITLTLTGTHSNFAALGTQTQPLGHGPNNVLSGVISNASGTTLKLVKSGTGSWILGGTNTYTGGTDLNGGTLYVASAQALGTTGTVSVLGNTTLRIANSHTGSVLNDISGRLSIADDTTFTYDTQSVNAAGFGTSAWAGQVATSGGQQHRRLH